MEQSLVPAAVRPDPERTQRHHYPVWLEIQTRFGDLDSLGHMNNVAIAQLYEEARVRFGATLVRRSDNALHRMLLVAFNINYLAETHYPEPVEVGTGVARIGRSSYVLAHALYQAGRCVGLADATMVHAPVTGVVPLPDATVSVLNELRLT